MSNLHIKSVALTTDIMSRHKANPCYLIAVSLDDKSSLQTSIFCKDDLPAINLD